ncbi:MAG: hypothetical protein JWR14_1129 [Caballeronia sp.]|jgi:RepB plasmid partitioning protein|nr:hypothetical protein [Caballeronia sp.]
MKGITRPASSHSTSGYTYNKHIGRLSQAQDARMLTKATAHDVSHERLATVLGIEPGTVGRKQTLLDGICREVQALLADKPVLATRS